MTSFLKVIGRDLRLVLEGAIRGGSIHRAKVVTGLLLRLMLVLSVAVAFGSDKKIIMPPGAKPGGNYSQGILVDGTLYISGQAGEDSAGQISKDFEAEVTQALENIGAVLKAAGMSPADVVSAQVYLTDAALFQRMNSVYTKYFKDPRPTRTTVIVSKLAGAGHVEITVTARK